MELTQNRGGCSRLGAQHVQWPWGVFFFFFFFLNHLSYLRNLPPNAGDTLEETWIRSLVREDPLEKEMATHSSDLA